MKAPYTKIQVSFVGLAGTTKSTTSKALKQELNIEYHRSAGDFVREALPKWGFATLKEFEIASQLDRKYDLEIDRMMTEAGKRLESCIFDGRMAWQCVPRSLKVLLTCDNAERFRRLAERDGKPIEEVEAFTLLRESSIRARFAEWYRVKQFDDPSNFDLVIDTTQAKTSQIVAEIVEFAQSRRLVLV